MGDVVAITGAPSPSRPDDDSVSNAKLWGCLIPLNPSNPAISRIDLYTVKRTYTVGRYPPNDIQFPEGVKISGEHCILEWDGDETPASSVKVTDLSTNGTYIDRRRIQWSEVRSGVLRDGHEISFAVASRPSNPAEDYRFVYRRVDNNAALDRGVHKEYDLKHVIGQGSYGTVVQAWQKAEGRWYAVKMIRSQSLRWHSNGDRSPYALTVQREIDVLARLTHRNICQLKESFIENGRLDIVLEFAPCGNLATYMTETGALPELQAQIIACQLCDALAYIHEMNIAHRDLKPANVLLASHRPIFIKVADFGLAKAMEVADYHTPCGTPAYVAPEVQTGFYSPKVDSWSVGVITYQMLTTKLPFSKTLIRAQSDAQMNWSTTAGVSEQARLFIGALLEYHSAKRTTLVHALKHAWLAEQPSSLYSGTPPDAASSSMHPSPQPLDSGLTVNVEAQARRAVYGEFLRPADTVRHLSEMYSRSPPGSPSFHPPIPVLPIIEVQGPTIITPPQILMEVSPEAVVEDLLMPIVPMAAVVVVDGVFSSTEERENPQVLEKRKAETEPPLRKKAKLIGLPDLEGMHRTDRPRASGSHDA